MGWIRCDVTAHFAQSFDLRSIVDNVRAAFDLGQTPRYKVDDVPDLDWVKEVQSTWKPAVIGNFLLRFPWHTSEDVESMSKSGIRLELVDDYKELLLEGGVAFGTG